MYRQLSVSYICICQYILEVEKFVMLNILHIKKIIRVENVSPRVHLFVENSETEPQVVQQWAWPKYTCLFPYSLSYVYLFHLVFVKKTLNMIVLRI